MDAVYPQGWSRMLNHWFSKVDEGRKFIAEKGGTLVPFGRQCFVCDAHYLRQLGIPEGDPDLEKVGPDWSRPKDREAWGRLVARLAKKPIPA